MPIIARYAVITVTPAVLILLGAAFGGYWPVMALLWLTLLGAGLDHVLPDPGADPGAEPWATRLSVGLGILHFLMIPSVLAGLDSASHSAGSQIVLFFAAASFMGQVSHPNAHDLIHRSSKTLQRLGAAVYVSFLYGHHVSAHRLVHHARVGTDGDPATPLPGEGFWAYVARAWPGNFAAGWAAEAQSPSRKRPVDNPYLIWISGAALLVVLVVWAFGFVGLVDFVLLSLLVHLQILLSDYVQHYGLQRLALPGGRLEPVSPHHSWDAPTGFSALLMMGAPRHSEHHMHPGRSFNELGTAEAGPRLPYPMPVMAVLALFPGPWRRVMDKRALKVMEAARDRLGLESAAAPGDIRQAILG